MCKVLDSRLWFSVSTYWCLMVLLLLFLVRFWVLDAPLSACRPICRLLYLLFVRRCFQQWKLLHSTLSLVLGPVCRPGLFPKRGIFGVPGLFPLRFTSVFHGPIQITGAPSSMVWTWPLWRARTSNTKWFHNLPHLSNCPACQILVMLAASACYFNVIRLEEPVQDWNLSSMVRVIKQHVTPLWFLRFGLRMPCLCYAWLY
jgi:hypothetical protein